MKEYSIMELQEAFKKGVLSSKELVKAYLQRIASYDQKLNSIADLNSHALIEAQVLDEEREEHGIRSLIHGIPILIKDNIMTFDEMRTTANSVVLGNYYAPKDATIIQKIRDAGGIILGKTNCSEFAYFMSMPKMPSGYGGLNGQVNHPYDRRIDPLGSSTGSAVAVAANFSTVSIGTETNGSLMSPARQCSVVSIKPTLGMVSREGIIPISSNQDTAGIMSRNVLDSAILLDIIKGKDSSDKATFSYQESQSSFLEATKKSLKGLKLGILEFDNYPNEPEEKTILDEAKTVFEEAGAMIIDLTFTYDLISNTKTLVPEFKRDLNAFLSKPEYLLPVSNLLEIIKFNQMDTKRIPYGQSTFYASQATSGTLKESEYIKARQSLLTSIEKFESLYEDHQLDAILTTKITGYPPIGGLPSLIVPAKALTDLTPRSLLFIGPKWRDEILFTLAHYYESKTHKRIPPQLGDENHGET